MTDWTGRCLCGEVRYRAEGQPLWQMHCHCESCRRTTGSPMTSYIGFERVRVAWTGSRRFHASSAGVSRGFCPQCGTPMSFESERWPDETHLFAATLDDPSIYAPQAHVHWAERVPWLAVDDGLPKHPGAG